METASASDSSTHGPAMRKRFFELAEKDGFFTGEKAYATGEFTWSEPQSTDQTPDLIVIENVEQNDFASVHFHNQAPSKIDSCLIVDRALQAPQAESTMPVRVFQ